jgi:hypothetical protein
MSKSGGENIKSVHLSGCVMVISGCFYPSLQGEFETLAV